ncbi:MAG: hypothetical protein DRQ01_01235 [Ignavibacteriae bacterium]|nr:MAG: hypothetical protein DRQ01_01235 [Ignavibacteriota bacterium]
MKLFVILITVIVVAHLTFAGDSLYVAGVLPISHSLDSEPGTMITIEFSTRVNPASINDTTFMVWGRWSGVHTGMLVFNSIGTIAYFNPDEDFFFGEMITVSLSKGIKDANGINLNKGYSWNFWIKVLPGTLDLYRTAVIEVRQPGEGQIQTYGTYAGDLNRDGWSDFLVPNEIPADVRVFMNDGQGGYDDFTIFNIIGGSRPSTNEGFDYNIDGLIDVAVGNSANNKVTIFTGDGNGGFSSIQNFNASSGVRGLVVLDSDGDGFTDIVTANRDDSNVSILINNRDGTFALPLNFDASGNGETAAASADVNGDGIMDIFIGTINSDKIHLWLGDGNGGFTFSDEVLVGNAPWMITAGDVNNDGIPDVVSANSGSASLSVVLCDSLGILSSPVNYPTGLFPIAIDLGDIDGDGDLDVVSSNYSGADFTMYENDGAGNYINRRNFAANSAGSCAVLHDRDNDGDMDMTGIDELEDLLILFINDPFVNVEEGDKLPNEFYLSQNHPNPFNPSTKISWQSPVSSWQTLKVYDVLGNEIATLVNEEKPAGEHEILFDGSELASGMYFYQLKVGNLSDTKKMILLR